MVFFMVRFYTGYMSPADYGTADIITQTANLLIPLVSLGMAEGVFRFAALRPDKGREAFTAGLASADGFDLETESANGILDVWSFGPALLDSEGKSISGFTDTVAGANPRSAIGYYEPGHYCFVAVDGRNAEGSSGYTLDELSQLFENLGCAVAYNLDGGQSSVMVWDGGSVTVNMPAGGGRPVGDIIYISKE